MIFVNTKTPTRLINNWQSHESKNPNLALTSVAVIEPLKKAILVNKLDAAAARAGIAQRIIRFARVSADPANILLVVIIQQIIPANTAIIVILFIVVIITAATILARRRTDRRRCGIQRRSHSRIQPISCRRRLRSDLHRVGGETGGSPFSLLGLVKFVVSRGWNCARIRISWRG